MVDTCLGIELEKLQIERDLTGFVHSLLDEQYEMMKQFIHQELESYRDMHQY